MSDVLSDSDVFGSETPPPRSRLSVDDTLLDAVRHVESGGNPNAVGGKGEIGPYQFMPATYSGLGLTYSQAKDENFARPAAKKFLEGLVNKFGSVELGLAAYNWGEGNLSKFGPDKMPKSTRAYIQKVLKHANGKPKVEVESGTISDEEVFAATSTTPATLPTGKTELPTLPDAIRGGLRATIDMGKRLLTDPRKVATEATREGWAVADLVTSGVWQMATNVTAQAVGRAVASSSGASRQEAASFGKEFGETIADHPVLHQPLLRLYDWVSRNEKSATSVDKAMEKISEMISAGGEATEKKTGGAVLASDVELLAGTFMARWGIQAQRRAFAGKGIDPVVEPKVPPPSSPSLVPEPGVDALYGRARPEVDPSQRRAINDSTGVSATNEALRKKAVKAQRKEVEDAFKDDPAYADQLQRFAEEEARLRGSAPPPLSAPGGLPQTGPRTPRTGLRTATTPPESAGGLRAPIETGAPATLDSALTKVRRGQGFDLTAEERIALRNTASAWDKPELVSEGGIPLRQRGNIDPKLMRLIAAFGVGGGLAAYASLNGSEEAGLGALAVGATLGGKQAVQGRLALSSLLRDADYTVKTLDRLPQNKTEFTREQVETQLARPDVSKAEKDLVTKVMEGKEKISAYDLYWGFQEAAEGLKLKAKEVSDYADYGLDQVGRTARNDISSAVDEWFPSETQPKVDSARTTLYRSDKLSGTYNNHFDDPKYFAHTRSFDEGGVRHVVEVQSDVAQHAKQLTPEKRAELQTQIQKAQAYYREVAVRKPGQSAYDFSMAVSEAALRVRELQAALGIDASTVQPLLKNWYKRVIREELARVPGQPVRFATADTVAKVEGWPRNDYWAREVERLEAMPRADVEPLVSEIAAAKELAARQGDRAFSPEHQSIYDRYKGDIEKFLRRELGGVEITDKLGHTWIEVPAQPRGPKQMFGRADVKTMATLAAATGAALAADAIQEDPSLTVDALAGVLAGAAVRLPARQTLPIAASSAVAAFLSSDENRGRNAALAGAFVGIAGYAASKNRVVADWARGTTEAAEVVLGNLSAELRTMSPPLLRRFTAHERDLKVREHKAMVQISPAAEALVKLPTEVREAIDVALFTGDRAKAVKLVASIGDGKLLKGMQDAFRYIDDTGAELSRLGLVKKLNVDHFPRIVTDLDGLMKALGKEGGDYLGRELAKAATESIKRTGAPLSDVEMSRIVNQHLLSAVNRPDLGGQSGILKKRTIQEVTKELLPYYATAGDSIALYARAASREIERAIFFGRDLVKAPDTLAVNVGASVGNLVAKERAAGRLSHEQLERLESLTKARFGPGERSTNQLTQTYRNIVQAMLIGNPLSAMVQFGDAAIAAAVHGLLPAIKSAVQTVTGQAKWKLSDFGLVNHISEDLIRGARDPLRVGRYEVTSAKFLDGMLKWSGFSFVDEFSKMVHLNAIAGKYEKLASTGRGVVEIQRQYADYFGKDMPQLLQDLRAKKKTPLVGELVFRELSDTQPISKLEMPQGYLASPHTRVMYTLKSFMIKQMNLVRERGFREIAKGDSASVFRGTAFLLKYGLALSLSGASINYIQDWILGKEPSLEASDVTENLFKSFGWSSYAIEEARKGQGLQALANIALPPYKLFEEIWDLPEEMEKFEEDDPKANPKGAMYIPLVGKLIYNRALGGAERANERKEREERRRLRKEMLE